MRLRLAFRTGAHRGHTLEFDPPRTLILGRSSQADLQIYDERISRRHCAIRVDPQGGRVKDLGSGNGTYLNGVEVRETVIADGDVLMIGRTEIELRYVEAAPPGAPFGQPARAAPPQPAAQSPLAAAFPGQLPALPPTMAPSYALGATAPAPQRAAAPPAAPPPSPLVGRTCAMCGELIDPATAHLAVEHRGRVLCARCTPRIEVPGYQIERTLGEGAMGVVYLARDLRQNLPVALKVLKVRGEITPDMRARFFREATTAAQLQHRHIVQVINMGEVPPFLYFVMEYVRGRSLKAWIDEHRMLPLPSVVRIAVQVGLALDHARERHIVHRDLKPENILVQDDGLAKLADFGLAKNVLTSGASGLTRPGDGLGTLPYMPPEQIEDALNADHRSDIYSFGATIYHMLTGELPFKGRTTLEYFKMIRDGSPRPISQFRQDVPRVIEILVEKAMAKRPEDRFQQVGDMLRILQQFLRTEFDTRQTAS
ncbi:MAG: serine/threonine-protein kinase [Planctomycetes bacterium]|nr:serine/threonine-protein kinase [Planctomycetota bacterium]